MIKITNAKNKQYMVKNTGPNHKLLKPSETVKSFQALRANIQADMKNYPGCKEVEVLDLRFNPPTLYKCSLKGSMVEIKKLPKIKPSTWKKMNTFK